MIKKIKDRTGAGFGRRLLETSALTLVFSAGLLAAGMGVARAGEAGNSELWDPIPGSDGIASSGISGNGKVIVGTIDEERAFYWSTVDREWIALHALPIYSLMATSSSVSSLTEAWAVNEDGSVIVGTSQSWDGMHAVSWTNGVIKDLGGLDDATGSYATGVSGDGSVVVGYSNFSSTVNSASRQAFRWKNNQIQGLDGLNGDGFSQAFGVSSDGKVIVGIAADGANGGISRAVSWTDEGQEVHDLGHLDGGQTSSAKAASEDGSVIIGNSAVGSANHAFRWTASGMKDINGLDSDFSVANAVSGDGSVVVGQVGLLNASHAFRWTEAFGMETVEDWLSRQGEDIGDDVTKTATGISADGTVIVGDLDNGGVFIARGGSGIIDVDQYNTTIAAKPSAQVGLGYANTVLQGAHGEPMRDLLGLGQRSVAFTADIGYDDSRVSNGGVGIGDVTFGYGLAEGVTARFAGGGLYTKQDIETGGDFHQAAFHMAPEATIALGSSNVYATIGGYYSTGRMNVHRGYMNGAAMDYSHGETDVDTYGAKIRFDWLNAATIAGTKLTPYASLTYAHSHMDGYTEEGGSFPSAFDSVNDHSTVARVGVDFLHELTDTVRLTARTEVDYRFEKNTAGISGEIVGLSAFDFAGEDVKQLWLRGAVGTEFDVAGGTASLGLNVTTEGDDPNVWLRSGWNVKF
ncbi:putative HAF family extracellular repeat protein [Rhizobium sp. OAE497]